jgi:hypothetical protein
VCQKKVKFCFPVKYVNIHIFPIYLGCHKKKTVGDGEKLLTYLNSSLKVLSGLDFLPRGTKKKLNLILDTVSKELRVSAQESLHQAYKYDTSKMKNVQMSTILYIEITCMVSYVGNHMYNIYNRYLTKSDGAGLTGSLTWGGGSGGCVGGG